MTTFIRLGAAAVAAALLAGPATAVTVGATTDIFLASAPNGTTVTGYFGSDSRRRRRRSPLP